MILPKAIRGAVIPIISSFNPRPSAGYPDWARFLKADAALWESARAAAKNGPKVLIANCAGLNNQVTTMDSLLAVALTLRGADVHILMCDEALPACWLSHIQRIPASRFAKSGPSQDLCGDCFLNGHKVFRSLGLPIHRYGDFISAEDLKNACELSKSVSVAEIERFTLDGMQIGEHALAGALRYYARGDLRNELQGEIVLRRYLEASLLTVFAVRRLLSTVSFLSVCGLHGLYVPEGLIGEVARIQGVGIVSWNEAYRKQTFIFSHFDTYHRTMLTEPTSNWKTMPWTDEMEVEITEYLRSRWYGTHDWIGYTQDWSEDVSTIATELGIDFTKPCIGLLTNVIWDAQVHYGGNAFSNMLEWTLETIRYFAHRPDLQLIVRVHPAEVQGVHRSRQLMTDEIKRAIPKLPQNVFIISPDSSMNTYAAMLRCNAVIIYGTKVGVELSSFGVPVVVAGEAWIRNKGLTLDASSAREYFDILDRLPLQEPMSTTAIQEARKYAYHFFFRRLIPLPFLRQTSGNSLFKLEISSIQELLPKRYPGLDVICNGIINGNEFIYRAEMYPQNLLAAGKFTSNFSGKVSTGVTNKPLVSVIVPTYNRADSLTEALASVYAQDGLGTLFDVEAIVVDSASPDRDSPIVSKHSEARCIKVDKTSTLSTIRNIGIKAATGKYIAFLDDSDLWLPQRLRSHVSVLENYPEIGAVYGQFITPTFGKEIVWPEAGTAPAGSVFNAFLMDELASLSVVTARREALEKAGYFDESLTEMEIYDMLLRLAFFASFAFVSGPSARGRFSLDSKWSNRVQRGRHQTELSYILGKAFALLPNSSEVPTLTRNAVSHWFSNIARSLNKPETIGLLRAHLLHSMKESPWMMSDPISRNFMLTYAINILSHMLQSEPRVVGLALRDFCHDVKGAQNGNYGTNAVQTRHFLGDVLTQTASQMWNHGDFKTAAYAATYALRQDSSQIVSQIHRASRRLTRVIFTTD